MHTSRHEHRLHIFKSGQSRRHVLPIKGPLIFPKAPEFFKTRAMTPCNLALSSLESSADDDAAAAVDDVELLVSVAEEEEEGGGGDDDA